MKKKIFIVLICFSLFGCKTVMSYVVSNTIGNYLSDGFLYIKKDDLAVNQSKKIIVNIKNNIEVKVNNNTLKKDDENYIKFLKNNYSNNDVLKEIEKMILEKYPNKEVVVKFDGQGFSGRSRDFPQVNKKLEKKYSTWEYRNLKKIENADIFIEFYSYQYLYIKDTENGNTEYKVKSILDACYISTDDNSFIYNENLTSENFFIEKSIFFDSNTTLQNKIKESYREVTKLALQ